MSRGLGRIQRGCLDTIVANGLTTTRALAEALYPDTEMIADAQLVAIRRALLSLERKGLLQPLTGYANNLGRWGTPEQVAASQLLGRFKAAARSRRVLAGLPVRAKAGE